MATWWGTHGGDLVKDLIIGVFVGGFLLLGGMVWDARLADRQNDLEKSIASSQDHMAQDFANQAEVLENTRFVRQLATTGGWRWKPFTSINLSSAQLGGLHLQCVNWRTFIGCADFKKADLHEANLTRTLLNGAGLQEADLHDATLEMADLTNANLSNANLTGVATETGARFRGATFESTRLVHARLPDSDFRDALFWSANADEAVLSSANFYHANLRLTHFKHADLRHASFRGANMTRVDMTSADLRGADFTRADLRKAVFTDVCFDDTTKWGSKPPPTNSSC